MLSRVAEAIYWMSRYVERAENLARFIDVTLNLILDQPTDGEMAQWEALIRATGDDKIFAERYGEPSRDNTICFLTFDRDYANSIISVLTAARENARSVRETISSEAWEQLNEFYHFVVRASETDEAVASPSEFFSEIKRQSHLFNGIVDSTMSHDKSWHFMNFGRLLERADKTSRILDVKYFTLLPQVNDVGTTIDDLQWSAVLRSVSGFEMYRKRHHGLTIQRVVEFLVLDRHFPRAVCHCLINANISLHEISGAPLGCFRNSAEQRLGRVCAELMYLDVEQISQMGRHEYIDGLQRSLNKIGEAVSDTFFVNTQRQSQSQG